MNTNNSNEAEIDCLRAQVDPEGALTLSEGFLLDTDSCEPDEFLPVSEFLVRVEGVDAVYVALRLDEEAFYAQFDPMLMQDFLGTVRVKMIAAALHDPT